MNLVFISIILLMIGQPIVTGFSFGFIFAAIGRIVFLSRLFGSVVPIKVSLVLEGCCVFFPVLSVIMNGGTDDWPKFLLTIALCGLASLLYIIDNANYLYVVEDDEE